MTNTPLKLLILCTGNSARSILAEAIVNKIGDGKIIAYSAGSNPKGEVHPQALALLAKRGHTTQGLRSKSWTEFTGPDAPQLDLVITVCANAAGETCPVWSGAPVRAHWGLPDPAAVDGTDAQVSQAFADAYEALDQRFRELIALHPETMDQATLKATLDALAPVELA